MPVSNLNFRDIGGLSAESGSTRHGVIFRSEGPRNFSAEQFSALQDMGFRSILDLRSARERDETPHSWHADDCQWHKLDVNADLRVFGHYGRDALNKGPEPEIAIAIMSETYREIIGSLKPHLSSIAQVLLSGSVPVLLNCTAGKDRTGVAIALLLEIAGVSREVIMQDYLRSSIFGENLKKSRDLEEGLTASFGFLPSPGQVDALIGARADYLDTAWDEIAREWSDVPSYFEAAGVDHASQRQIRSVLIG
ncbi:MAG: protein tyrosine phosphatase [Hirschia sp.]|nr:protein tyrosine phosphatase [Hirschia sp.]MBF16813.1 protein tyrosine phosphatase [Hirschia sp.]|tara:strand:- start:299 stop:1051 length:753 start_codon:yes stop_codon:yes gene_type:complete